MKPIGTRRPETAQEFEKLVASIQDQDDYREPAAFAMGLARIANSGEILDVRFPVINKDENHKTAALIAGATDNFEAVDENGVLLHADSTYNQLTAAFSPIVAAASRQAVAAAMRPHEEEPPKPHLNINAINSIFKAESAHPERHTVKPVLAVVHDLDSKPQNAVDALLRLHLLSTRKVQPHGVNLDGIFGLLTNVAWTSEGPVLADDINRLRADRLIRDDILSVHSVDKFPHMLDYVAPPSGVRIVDGANIRLGAHLAEGTTVMSAGAINFNAGTLGKAMVEGRISANVVVGAGSDIGGGASIMGTLSGGGTEVISVGEDCLIGANAGIGISLGDNCVVEAGAYITAGMKVAFEGKEYKAEDLSGSSGLLFRRNSQTGAVEALSREGKKVELNPTLHAN